MLSARTIYGEIFDNDEAFGLFCSIAASGEAQGGWENGKIAALVPGSQADLAAKIARHGADEDKHGRIFMALLRKRGLEPVAVPPDADYTMRLEAAGIGLAHARLRREEELTEAHIVSYLAHSRVTEQRASEQMRALRRPAGDRPDIGRAVRVISNDEDNHHEAGCHRARAGRHCVGSRRDAASGTAGVWAVLAGAVASTVAGLAVLAAGATATARWWLLLGSAATLAAITAAAMASRRAGPAARWLAHHTGRSQWRWRLAAGASARSPPGPGVTGPAARHDCGPAPSRLVTSIAARQSPSAAGTKRRKDMS